MISTIDIFYMKDLKKMLLDAKKRKRKILVGSDKIIIILRWYDYISEKEFYGKNFQINFVKWGQFKINHQIV